MPNDLEFAVKDLYNELKYLHNLGFQMSGSGPSFFIKKPEIDCNISKDDYLIFENLTSVKKGVEII